MPVTESEIEELESEITRMEEEGQYASVLSKMDEMENGHRERMGQLDEMVAKIGGLINPFNPFGPVIPISPTQGMDIFGDDDDDDPQSKQYKSASEAEQVKEIRRWWDLVGGPMGRAGLGGGFGGDLFETLTNYILDGGKRKGWIGFNPHSGITPPTRSPLMQSIKRWSVMLNPQSSSEDRKNAAALELAAFYDDLIHKRGSMLP